MFERLAFKKNHSNLFFKWNINIQVYEKKNLVRIKKPKTVKNHIVVYFLNIHTFNFLNSCHNAYLEALQNVSVSSGTTILRLLQVLFLYTEVLWGSSRDYCSFFCLAVLSVSISVSLLSIQPLVLTKCAVIKSLSFVSGTYIPLKKKDSK